MPFFKFSFLSVVLGTTIMVPPLLAAESLSLAEALALALQKNPTLQVHSLGVRMAEARILQAGIKPNPKLSVEFEKFLGDGAFSGTNGLETTLQLSQVIDLADSRKRSVETATASRDLVGADYEIQRIEVFSEVANRFTRAAVDEERLMIARNARELAEKAVEAVRARVKAGKTSSLELNKVLIPLALLKIDEEHAEHELATSRQALAASLGEVKPTFGQISANIMALPSVPEFSSLSARMEDSSVLARYALEARWREAQVRLAQSLRRSGPLLSAGLRRAEASDDVGFVAGVSMPLPVRDQSKGSVREARERRAQVDQLAEVARLEMHATLFAVYQEMVHARTALMLLREEIIPAAQEILALTNQGYRSGRFSLLELLDAQKSLIELRGRVLANAETFHLYVIEIERLLGAPLEGEVTRP
jgi:cobalt-zinc-cadmium efflux system outer membrane protein